MLGDATRLRGGRTRRVMSLAMVFKAGDAGRADEASIAAQRREVDHGALGEDGKSGVRKIPGPGSMQCIRLTQPSPSQVPSSKITSVASASPRSASSSIIFAVSGALVVMRFERPLARPAVNNSPVRFTSGAALQ